jgi:DcmR-like sensory protein
VTLLVDGPTGRHLAQFHRDAAALSDSVLQFVEAGLRRDNSVLVIASAAQLEQLLDRLTERKFNVKSLRNSAQLGVMDATKVAAQYMSENQPEWGRFRAALLPMLSRFEPYGRGTRIYSELSGTLWRDGNVDGAIRLEELWNTLAVSHPFSLYCGYTMDTHREESYAPPLEELGRAHSDILSTPEDEQFGQALDRASKEIFGISLTQMAGVAKQDGVRRFPSGQRAMLWVKRNLPMSTSQLAERARHYFKSGHA